MTTEEKNIWDAAFAVACMKYSLIQEGPRDTAVEAADAAIRRLRKEREKRPTAGQIVKDL
jgi:hypothetical protein